MTSGENCSPKTSSTEERESLIRQSLERFLQTDDAQAVIAEYEAENCRESNEAEQVEQKLDQDEPD
jgi:hypothetical protein